jgi:hypothetical protein
VDIRLLLAAVHLLAAILLAVLLLVVVMVLVLIIITIIMEIEEVEVQIAMGNILLVLLNYLVGFA